MRSRFVFLAFVLCLLLPFRAAAQNNAKVTVELQDATSGEPVGFASVSLTEKGAQKVYKYVSSDADGKASFEKVKPGNYTVKAELMGYQMVTKDITVKGDTNVGLLKMEVDKKLLDAASVSAVTNPIIIKKDTIEYNASSFKSTDNDMLEALLKKLPGVEVEDDGTVKANGETISKIYIDGKTFFMDDPQLATQNIPAKMVEKIKVVKKKSEQAEFSGIDDGQEETVIDLSVQKSMMNGLFANVLAGGGHDIKESGYYDDETTWKNDGWRFQTNAMIGNFKQDSQISIILNANNGNRLGFNDIAGGNMQGMRGGMGGGGGGIAGMGGGGGITTSWMGGLNGSIDLFDNNMELGGNYLYNGSRTLTGSESSKTTYLADGNSLLYNNISDGVTRSDGHRFGIRLEHKFSDNTSILFEPQVNFGRGNYNSSSIFSTTNNVLGNVNDGWSSNMGDNSNWATNGRFLFRQRLGIPGRTLSVNLDWNVSQNHTNAFNQSFTNTYADYSSENQTEDQSIVNQRTDQKTTSTSLSGRLEYTEPLGGDFYLSGNYSYSWSESKSVKDAYNSGEFDVEKFKVPGFYYNYDGEVYDPVYSSSVYNRFITQQLGANLMYQTKKARAQVGFSAMPRSTFNQTNGKTYEDKAINWAPNASIFADFGENSNLRFFYNGSSAQPSTSQLMPVMDNSNPLNMTLGNPYLKSYFTHSFRGDYGYTNKQSFFSARLGGNGSYVNSPVVNAIWYDQAGVQYTFPINGKPSYSGNMQLMLNIPIAKSNFRITNNTNIGYSNAHSYVGNGQLDMSEYFNESKEFDYVKFHDDYFGDNPTKSFDKDFIDNKTQNLNVMENLRFTYRSDYLEITLGGRTRMQKPWYTVNTSSLANTTWTNTATGSFTWTVGNSGWAINADGNYNWYNGYTTNPGANFILNSEISKQVFRRRATLALKGYDLFNQTKSLSVSDTSNYHEETRSLALGRYVIVSLTFRFGTFGRNRSGNSGGMGPGAGGPPPGGMSGPPSGGMGGPPPGM